MATNKKNFPAQILLIFGTAIFVAILWMVNLLPYPLKLRIGKGLGYLLYLIPNSRTRVSRVNISLCFPDMSAQDKEAMVKRNFINFGASLIESAMGWWDPLERIYGKTEIIGLEHLTDAQAQQKGVLLIGAHFSTLDLSGAMVSKYVPVYAMYREQTNPLFNRVVISGRIGKLAGLIPHTSMRIAAKTLKAGNIVWYSPDQDMGIEHSVFAPFFGHPAATLTATAKLAKLSGSPLIMLATYRKPDDSGYIVHLLPGPKAFPSGNDEQDAATVNQMIEQGVRLAPDQYYWFHRRFKSQPNRSKGELYQ